MLSRAKNIEMVIGACRHHRHLVSVVMKKLIYLDINNRRHSDRLVEMVVREK